MKDKYSKKVLHPIRHMGDYYQEVEAGKVSAYRSRVLMDRFSSVKKLTFQIYEDTYNMIVILDGEQPADVQFLWKRDLLLMQNCPVRGRDYSKKVLHPVRHISEYMKEIRNPETSSKRLLEIKKRCSKLLSLSVLMYYDAERLIKKIDGSI